MKSYSIREVSLFYFLIVSLILISFVTGIIVLLFPNPPYHNIGVISIFTSLAIVLITFFLVPKIIKLIATTDIELTIDGEGLKKKWVKQFIFQNKQDLFISWSDIRSYLIFDEPENKYSKFKMLLSDGSKFIFYHNKSDIMNDDYLNFIEDFILKVQIINNIENKFPKITIGKNIFQSNWGILMIAVFTIMVLAYTVKIFITPLKYEKDYSKLPYFYIGSFIVIVYIILQRRKYKS